MELARDERKHRTLKVYLTEYVRSTKGDYCYRVGNTLIPNDMIELIGHNDNTDLPIVHFKSEIIVGFGGIPLGINELCVNFYKNHPYVQIWIPTRLIEKIVEENIELVTWKPQHSPAESRA